MGILDTDFPPFFSNADAVKPATLTITPVGSSTSSTSANANSSSVIQMVTGGSGTNTGTRLMRSSVRHVGSEQDDQPDTTESLD